MSTSRSRVPAYAALMVQTIISSVSYLVNKRALLEIPVTVLATVRFSLASVMFLLLLWRLTPHRWPERADWKRIGVLAILGVPINQLCFLGGLARTSAAHGALMYTLTPLFVLFIALALRTERLTPAKVIGLAVALSGAALVVFERAGNGMASGNMSGDLEILIAVVAWAGYTALGKPLAMKWGPIAATAWPMAIGTLLFLPIGVPEMSRMNLAAISRGAWIAVAFLVVFTSVVAYLAWYFALGTLDSSRVAVFTNLQPVMTAITSWLVFGEPITARLAVGGLLVIGGVLVTTRPTLRVARSASIAT